MADIAKILMLERELCDAVAQANAIRKQLLRELATHREDDRKTVNLIPVTDAPDFEYHGDAQKANSPYFRWWVYDYGSAGMQCIEIACPTLLRGNLHFVVERFAGAGY